MNKQLNRILVIIILWLASMSLYTLNYYADKEVFLANQQQIQTAQFSGTAMVIMKANLEGARETVVNIVESDILLFAKGAAKLKMVISGDDVQVVLMQYEDNRYQKSGTDGDTLVTPVTASCNLHGNYFLYDLDPSVAAETVLDQESVDIGGKILNKYTVEYGSTKIIGCNGGESFVCTSSVIWFNADGMIVKKEDFAGDTVRRITVVTYSQVNGIWLASGITVQQMEGGLVLESTSTYTDLQVNLQLADSVFQL